jgi:hypothetical protein
MLQVGQAVLAGGPLDLGALRLRQAMRGDPSDGRAVGEIGRGEPGNRRCGWLVLGNFALRATRSRFQGRG